MVVLGQTQAADSFSGPDFKSLVRKAEPLPVGESLKAFDVPCENNDSATVQKAYRKALIKYHPDKAQRKGESWQKVAESEEIYKLVQNEYQKVRSSL